MLEETIGLRIGIERGERGGAAASFLLAGGSAVLAVVGCSITWPCEA